MSASACVVHMYAFAVERQSVESQRSFALTHSKVYTHKNTKVYTYKHKQCIHNTSTYVNI